MASGIASGRYVPRFAADLGIGRVDSAWMLIVPILTSAMIVFAFDWILQSARSHVGLIESAATAKSMPVLAVLLVPGYLIAYYQAMLRGSPVSSQAMIYLWPCLLFAMYALARNRPGSAQRSAAGPWRKQIVLLCLAFVGATFISLSSTKTEEIGIVPTILSLVAAFAIALLFVGFETRIAKGRLFEAARSFSYFFGCAVGLVVLLLLDRVGLLARAGVSIVPDSSGWIIGAWMGGVVLGVGHILWTNALATSDSGSEARRGHVIGISYFTPIVSALALQVIFRETITELVLLGIFLIVFANQLL